MDLAYLLGLGLPICRVDPSVHSLKDWTTLQRNLRTSLQDSDDPGWSLQSLRRIGGMDISFETGTNRATAVLVVCELVDDGCDTTSGTMAEVYEDAVDVDMDLPYISGFLFVREIPAYELLLQRLRTSAPHLEPDVFLIDGSGLFHPRQCGSASHFGISSNVRTIGVAKKLLCFDDFDKAAGERVEQHLLSSFGDSVALMGSSGFVYGLALRTAHPLGKDASSKRIYLSVGHRFSLESAKEVILKCCDVGGSYLPEPIRLADLTGRAIERIWTQMHSGPETRQIAMDISNLLDNKSRKTLLDMLSEASLDPHQKLADLQTEKLKRKRATVEELFLPLQGMYPETEVAVVLAALRMEKPWAINLRKANLHNQQAGKAMRAS
eukprot:Skav219127  [mRNA]  locus=scaffold1574:530045:531184:+ [translate_table: standard]